MKGWLLARTIIAWILVVVDLVWLAATTQYPKSADLRLLIQHPSFAAYEPSLDCAWSQNLSSRPITLADMKTVPGLEETVSEPDFNVLTSSGRPTPG